MSLSTLTAAGWIILALALIFAFGFVLNVVQRNYRHAAIAGFIDAILWTLVLYLVTS